MRYCLQWEADADFENVLSRDSPVLLHVFPLFPAPRSPNLQAYETLSSPEKRCLYDFMGAFAHLSERNWSQPGPQATSGDSYSAQPASRCGSASSVSSLDSYTSLENAGMATSGLLGKRPAPSHAPNQQPGPGGPPCVDADVLVQLRLTLEELFTGCTKQLRLKRKLFLQVPGLGHDVATGSWAETEELFRIVVSPGAREGTRFSFAGKFGSDLTHALGNPLLQRAQKPGCLHSWS